MCVRHIDTLWLIFASSRDICDGSDLIGWTKMWGMCTNDVGLSHLEKHEVMILYWVRFSVFDELETSGKKSA